MTKKTPSLFEVWGIEIEYMIVNSDSLDVRSIADQVLRDAARSDDWVEDVADGEIGWSNELVSHVLEVKNIEPAPSLEGLGQRFQRSVDHLNRLVRDRGSRLMPSGMHPWMDPTREASIWPHESGPVYQAYHRLFDCRRHGWANVQSVHLNLPFADEHEFARLMAATRLVLPLIPALAASSPILEGRATGHLDNRLEFYRGNAARVPSMTGEVIPEAVFGYEEYRARVLEPITRDLQSAGADRILLDREWTNARGAIARFDRMAVEIRLIDAQECPLADLAVAAAIGGAVAGLVGERWAPFRAQRQWSSKPLVELLEQTSKFGPHASIRDQDYPELFGADPTEVTTAGALWQRIAEHAFGGPPELEEALAVILRRGTLAERVLGALGSEFDRGDLRRIYRELCDCLSAGRPFRP